MRRTTFLAAALGLAAAGFPMDAQTLESRVAQAPDGVVRMQVDSRTGVCGDGRDVIGYRSAIFARNFQSIGGHWNNSRCVVGPLRVSLTIADGHVRQLRTQVGGSWPATDGRVTDLGQVPAAEASAYFFALVPRLEQTSGKDRLLIPAVLADGPPVIEPLLSLARDPARAEHTRRAAIQWLGLLGDASVIPALVQFARDDGASMGGGKKSIATSALAALSTLDGDIGVPALIDLARSGSADTRREAVFWLGQNGDPRARRMLHTVIENDSESRRVRSHAIFSLTHGGDTPLSEFSYLRSVYSRLGDDELKEAVIQGMSQDDSEGGRWLLGRALDDGESVKLRRSALFWAGQRNETPTAELVRAYRELRESGLREHAIFVLSQRKDDAATQELLRIAREERDPNLRSKALFWLAQSDDPRVRQLIADLILK